MVSEDLLNELHEITSVTRIRKHWLFGKKKWFIPSEEVRYELLFMRKGIDTALMDCFSDDPLERKEAKEFFYLRNPNFIELCELSLLEPESVYTVFLILKKTFASNGEDKHTHDDVDYLYYCDLQLVKREDTATLLKSLQEQLEKGVDPNYPHQPRILKEEHNDESPRTGNCTGENT